jgi:hypothetical protein
MALSLPPSVFECAPDVRAPSTDEEFLTNVDMLAELFGVEAKQRELAMSYLKAVCPPVTQEDLAQREMLIETAVSLMATAPSLQEERAIVTPSLFLLRRLTDFDYELGEEGVDVAELADGIISRLDEIMGTATSRLPIWSDGLGHDDGKTALNPGLNEKSKKGEEWTPSDAESMKDHSAWGYILSLAAGQHITVARMKYANHAKQTSSPYGEEVNLDREERRGRDAVAAADDILACLTRSNSRNKYLPESERWNRVYASLLWRFGDFNNISARNNPETIIREVIDVGRAYISPRFKLEQESSGLVVVHRLGARVLSLAGAR